MTKTSEELRLSVLESYDIEDGYPKDHLKSIIKLASEICSTPISLIDIIDDFNQRTIATHGEWEEKVIPRDKSICDKAVVEGEMLIINDVESNEDISSRLSEEDKKKIKFYAGAPLKTPEGFILGALCVIDSKPRQLNDFQKESLQVLADEVMARLDLHRQAKILKRQNNKLEKYSVFLNNSADILCIIDPVTTSIQDINEDCYKELGFTRDELLHSKFTDFVESDIDIQKAIKTWFEKERSNKERLSLPVKLKNKLDEEKWYRCNFTSENDRWYITARNITDTKKAEDRAATMRFKFEKVANATADLIYEMNWKTQIINWSASLTEFLGYPESDRQVDFKWWQEKIHPEDVDEVMKEIAKVVDTDEIKWRKSYRLRAFDGTYKYVNNNSHIDRDSNGTPSNILGALADITQLKKAEIRQNNLLSRLKHANQLASLGFWEMDLKHDSIVFDDEMYHILGLKKKPKKPSLSLILNQLDEDTEIKFLEFIQKIKEGNGITEQEHEITTTDTTIKYLLHRAELIYEHGVPRRILVTTQDITEQKLRELHITESLKEKEILLSEIHHRVKNNLAIISALLELNLFQVEDNGTINFIRSSQLRIKSMAKIHEQLYQSDSFSHVSFENYIPGLIETIQSTMTTGLDPEIKTDIEDINLNINYAIPCGLILNELISNAWKHAFPNQKPGSISISLFSKEGKIHLHVKDDGVGIPGDLDPNKVNTLGLTLIKILSQQIEAKLSLENTKSGFSCKLSFIQKKNRRGSSGTFV